MSPAELLRRIGQKGWLNTLEMLFNRVVPVWLFRFSSGDVFQLDLDGLSDAAGDAVTPTHRLERITDPAQRATLRTVTWNSVPLETTLDDDGYAIIDERNDGRILGGVWCGFNSFSEQDLGFCVVLEPNQGWIYCAYVDRSLRGRGLYQQLLRYVAADVRRRDEVNQLFVIVQPWNHASIHVHRKFSQRRVGRITVIRLFGWAWVWTRGDVRQDRVLTRRIQHAPITIRFQAS